DLGRVLVDEQYLVPVVDQLAGDGAADRPGPGDSDLHECAPSGARPATSRSVCACCSSTRTCSASPSCTIVDAVGNSPAPNRVTTATWPPVAASKSRTSRQIQPSCGVTRTREIAPDGSRHTSSVKSPSTALSSRLAVQGTVAIVGMPSRSY